MALEETTFHTSPPHHYERIRSLLPTRLSSFPVVLSLPYAFPVSPFILLLFTLFWCWIYSGHYLLFGLFVFDCFVILQGLSIFLGTYAHAWIHVRGESFPRPAHPS